MFVFCLKSSHAMGMGHFFRMLNLRRALAASGISIVFVLLGEHAPAQHWLEAEQIDYAVIDEDIPGWEATLIDRYKPRVWVNDRLDTMAAHVALLQAAGIKVVTFDDRGNGAPLVDLHVSALGRARGEKPLGKKILEGVEYLILPPEVARYRHQREKAESFVVCLGGSDTYGMTIKVAQWLAEKNQRATLILGPGFLHEKALAQVVTPRLEIKRSPSSLMQEFQHHDIAITGGGLTAFEATAAGLPTFTIANEPHEIGHCLFLEEIGCSRHLGYKENVNLDNLSQIDVTEIKRMSLIGLASFPSDGAQNITKILMSILNG